jgi:effector-binding domain-containing protein
VWERSIFGVEIRRNWDACESLRQYGIAQHRDWRELYEDARCVERAEIEGRAVWVLHLFPRALVPLDEAAQKQVPPPDVWYLAVDDGLPLRIETRAPGLLGEPAITRLDFTDWRRTDGIAYPRTVRLTISGFTLRLDYQSVRHDAELAPGFFAPDEEILAAENAGTDEGEAVRIETVEPRHLAAVRVRCAADELQSALAMALPEAMQRVVSTGATVVGAPLVVYHSFGETHDIEAAIPIAEPIEGKGRVQPGELPGGAAVVTWHRGPYDRLERAHERVMAYLDEHGLERRGAPWEEYWTDPGMEPDPAKWRTKLVWPIVARPTARASADGEPTSGGR